MATKRIPAQPFLSGFEFSKKLSFGGSGKNKQGKKLTGNPKEARPIAPSQALHVVMRSSQATGTQSLLLKGRRIEQILRAQAARFGVRLYDLANAGNHLHLVVKVSRRKDLFRFLKASCGLIAREITGAQRGSPKIRAAARKFWDARPFTRIVSWGPDYAGLKRYLEINRIEMFGWDRLTTRAILARVESVARNCRLAALGFS